MTVIGDVPPVALKPPVFEVTVYEVIAEPPLFTGGVKLTIAEPLLRTALTSVGASGTVAGVAELLALEAMLLPTPFVATTVKV